VENSVEPYKGGVESSQGGEADGKKLRKVRNEMKPEEKLWKFFLRQELDDSGTGRMGATQGKK